KLAQPSDFLFRPAWPIIRRHAAFGVAIGDAAQEAARIVRQQETFFEKHAKIFVWVASRSQRGDNLAGMTADAALLAVTRQERPNLFFEALLEQRAIIIGELIEIRALPCLYRCGASNRRHNDTSRDCRADHRGPHIVSSLIASCGNADPSTSLR